MSSPVGHILGALALHRSLGSRTPADAPAGAKGVLLVAALALAPDLDLVWGWRYGDGTLWHRGFTHSVVFAAGLALLGNIVWYHSFRALTALRSMLALFAVCLVHPLLDFLMGRPGVALLAPFRGGRWFSPVQLVPTAYYPRRFGHIAGLLADAYVLRGMFLELCIFLPLLVAAKPGQGLPLRLAMLLISAGSLTATVCLYN